MEIVKPGLHYRISTVKGTWVDIIFFHKNKEEGAEGFCDGITTEELLKVLMHRHEGFAKTVDTVENINTWTHLRQAASWWGARLMTKYKRKRFKKK